jgi:hypothetical protein
VPVPAPFRSDDSEVCHEIRRLRAPRLVRRHASMEKHKWLARTFLVVPSLQLADLGIATHNSLRSAQLTLVPLVPRRLLTVTGKSLAMHQFAVTALASGLMWANMLRRFQVGKARTSHEGPSSRIRESRVASAHEIWPACHFTNASASAVM